MQVFILLALVCAAQAQDIDQVVLSYRPEFARSLPIQILASGIALTLVAILLVHLFFIAQFHWSLAPVNYVLQLFAVFTLLVAHSATLHIVLSETEKESHTWPYMLSYAAIYPDPSQWPMAKRVVWCAMAATTAGLIQITHVQLLTLLYPSRLEVMLVYVFLIPICIFSAGFDFLELHPADHIQDIATGGRHVCNATIYILFATALFLWGFKVNKTRAWRIDGGTAVFGAATLSLAAFSTALYILYVSKEHLYRWMSSLLWTVVVWQNFFGWWWWVGARGGSILSDLDEKSLVLEMTDLDRREERKRTKSEKKTKRTTRSTGEAHVRTTMTVDDESGTPSSDQLTSSGSSSASQGAAASGWRSWLRTAIHEWCQRLKKAHRAAARKQTAEQAERILEMEHGGMIPLSRFNFKTSEPPLNLRRDDTDENGNQDSREALERVRNPPEGAPPLREPMMWWGPLRRW